MERRSHDLDRTTAGDGNKVDGRDTEHGVRRPGGGPHAVEGQQGGIDEDGNVVGQTHRRNPTDGEPGDRSHGRRIRQSYGRSSDLFDAPWVHGVPTARKDQPRRTVVRHEQQRLDDLVDVAPHGVGCLASRSRGGLHVEHLGVDTQRLQRLLDTPSTLSRCHGTTIPLRTVRTMAYAPRVIDSSTWLSFVIASLALLVIPGPSVTYVWTVAVERGAAAGCASVVGVGAGAFVHFVAAAFGWSAVLATSERGFTLLAWAGGAYLVVVGLRTLLRSPTPVQGSVQVAASPPRRMARIALQGVLVTLANVKLALFVLAFVPPFLDPTAGSVAVQTLALGVVFVALAAVTDGVYAASGAWFGSRLAGGRGGDRWRRWISGPAYVGLGIFTLVAHRL